jgi:DNA primase
MDVIALHRAGFATAVAPLGTALTETQIEALWRLAPEPVLCFDGDAAGQRAAGRALDRALPMLKPGHSLKFAALPQGEDPDTLILNHGREAMREVLENAAPLAEVLWAAETAHPVETPEQRAALEHRLEERVRSIADRSLQQHYRAFFRDRLYKAFRQPRPAAGRWVRGRPAGPNVGISLNATPAFEGKPQVAPTPLRRRQQELLLALLLNHPFLLEEVTEDLTGLRLPDPHLDKLCHEILRLHALYPDLDAVRLKLHLTESGYARVVQGVLSPQVLKHGAFVRPEADAETVRMGWSHIREQLQQPRLKQDLADAEQDFVKDFREETWARLQHTILDSKKDDDGATGGGVR